MPFAYDRDVHTGLHTRVGCPESIDEMMVYQLLADHGYNRGYHNRTRCPVELECGRCTAQQQDANDAHHVSTHFHEREGTAAGREDFIGRVAPILHKY